MRKELKQNTLKRHFRTLFLHSKCITKSACKIGENDSRMAQTVLWWLDTIYKKILVLKERFCNGKFENLILIFFHAFLTHTKHKYFKY